MINDAEIEKIKKERDTAIQLLAEWCVAIDLCGGDWDVWDGFYKTARYGDNSRENKIIRSLLDDKINTLLTEK